MAVGGPLAPGTQMPAIVTWALNASQFAYASNDYPLPVAPISSADGQGYATKYVSCTASTNATIVKAAPGKIFKIKAFNNGSVPVWLKLYNLATTPVPASSPVFDKYEIIAGSGGAGLLDDLTNGQAFDAGIGFAVTANFSDTDNTAIGTGVVSVTVLYL